MTKANDDVHAAFDATSNTSPNLISAIFMPPPPIDNLPPAEPVPQTSKTTERIGLFELRRRLDHPHASPTRSASLGPINLLTIATTIYYVHTRNVIDDVEAIVSFVLSLGSVFYLLMHVTAVLSMIGTVGLFVSPSLASLVHDILSPSDEDDAPMPTKEQRRRYHHMIEEREARKARKHVGLLSLAINLQWPTDAGGAPIDVDSWGDF